MAGDNTRLFGVSILGLGFLFAISAYKNKELFGANGIVTQAIQTGNITGANAPPLVTSTGGDVSANGDTSEWFPSIDDNNAITDGPVGSGNHDVFVAIKDISLHNYNLAVQTTHDFVTSNKQGLQTDILLIQQLGLFSDANVIRQHAGVSI
jgi:hypothetical protein